MPVSSLTFLMLTALLLTPVWTLAQSRVIVKHAYQLERAPAVQRTRQAYTALASAYLLYDKCGKELAVTEEQREYLKNKFIETARAYQIAYQDAYVEYVGAMPNQAMVDDMAQTIKAQQQKAVNNTALMIRKNGCKNDRFAGVVKYARRTESLDLTPAPDPITLEPRAKFGKKH